MCLLPFLLFLALRVFAHANPPDPLWVAGIYDEGDVDAVLDLVRVAYVVPDLGLAASVRPLDVTVAVPPSVSDAVARISVAVRRPRSPPS